MPGDVFVTLGDITEFQADAVVCPTSTSLGHGFASAAFAQRFPEFDAAFRVIKASHPARNEYRQRLNIGDAFWIPIGTEEDRLRGIVLVAVTGGWESIAERAALSVQNAIRKARENLRQVKSAQPCQRWLIAIPTIGLGLGGYSRELKTATEVMVRAAAEEVQAAEDMNGVTIEIDVVFVAFTLVNYRLLLDARLAVAAEPPCPPLTIDTRDLLNSIRERRCVLFVGAGLSKGAGLPDWSGLLRELAEKLGLKDEHLPRDANGQLSLDLCLDLAQWYVDQFEREHLERRIHETFGRTAERTPAVRPTLAHYHLASAPFRLFLTTNYDDLIERTLTGLRRDPELVIKPENVVHTGQAERPCVVKLHGDATARTAIVLTRDDFDTFFRNHPVTTALLQGLLLNHTFLFVGYDLRDPNTRQLYSGVAHLLGKTGARAYSVVVREEDKTSGFYERQWGQQGLITLHMPGPDAPARIHNSWRFFDWLVRQTCDRHSLLHPDLRNEDLPADLQDLARLRDLLSEVGDQIPRLIHADPLAEPSESRTRVLAAILELATRLGWRPARIDGTLGQIWEDLANATHDRVGKLNFLRRALGSAESIAELNRLREMIKGLAGQTAPPQSDIAE